LCIYRGEGVWSPAHPSKTPEVPSHTLKSLQSLQSFKK
jgi:hypothetical protein